MMQIPAQELLQHQQAGLELYQWLEAYLHLAYQKRGLPLLVGTLVLMGLELRTPQVARFFQ
jgi:hypothetical protein